MRKTFAFLLLIALLALMLCAVSAADGSPDIVGRIEDGRYVLVVSLHEGQDWRADEAPEKGTAVRLVSSEIADGKMTVCYEPVEDGSAVMTLSRYEGVALKERHGFELVVRDGRIVENVSGYHTAAPEADDLAPHIVGKWQEKVTQFVTMTVTEAPEGGFDAVIESPVSHGAYLVRAQLCCSLDDLVYENARVYDLDGTGVVPEAPSRVDPRGSVRLITEDGKFTGLVWTNGSGDTVEFERAVDSE